MSLPTTKFHAPLLFMSRLSTLAACILVGASSHFIASAAPLTPGEPILLPGTKGRFDFIRIDPSTERLLLGHGGNNSFDVFDAPGGKLLKSFAGCDASDAAADPKRGNYYASCANPARVVIVDSAKLEITGEVPLPADPDLITCDPVTGLVHVCNDKSPEQWVVDPVAKKIVATIPFQGGGMEDMAFSPDGKFLYQALKGSSDVAVVDLASNAVAASWSCAPEKGPWGLAMASEINGLLASCAGKLLLFDCASGKVSSAAPIAARVDEMAYDPGLRVAYTSSRQGFLSATAVEAGKLTPLGDVPTEKGCADVTVDPKTHLVWIAYPKGDQVFVQSFAPAK
jgi:DNA-binding beta-propeller fold protein YncE